MCFSTILLEVDYISFFSLLLFLSCVFFKIVDELSKLEKSGLEAENSEVHSLKKRLSGMEISESVLRGQLSKMVRRQQTNRDKISSLLSDNSRLVTECDALAVTVKAHNGDLVDTRKTIEELGVTHGKAMRLLEEENERLKVEMEETKGALGQLKDESLKLFEEGYRECWGRGEARGLDMEPDKFEAYLGELKEKIKKGVHDAEMSAKPVAGDN